MVNKCPEAQENNNKRMFVQLTWYGAQYQQAPETL